MAKQYQLSEEQYQQLKDFVDSVAEVKDELGTGCPSCGYYVEYGHDDDCELMEVRAMPSKIGLEPLIEMTGLVSATSLDLL